MSVNPDFDPIPLQEVAEPVPAQPVNEANPMVGRWYDIVHGAAQAGLHPSEVDGLSEQRFSRALHAVVADNVAYNRHRRSRHPVLPRELVDAALSEFYGFFSPLRPLSEQQVAERRDYAQQYLPVAEQYRYTFLEVNVVGALRGEFLRRRQSAAVRAASGLLIAYGTTLSRATPETISDWINFRDTTFIIDIE